MTFDNWKPSTEIEPYGTRSFTIYLHHTPHDNNGRPVTYGTSHVVGFAWTERGAQRKAERALRRAIREQQRARNETRTIRPEDLTP